MSPTLQKLLRYVSLCGRAKVILTYLGQANLTLIRPVRASSIFNLSASVNLAASLGQGRLSLSLDLTCTPIWTASFPLFHCNILLHNSITLTRSSTTRLDTMHHWLKCLNHGMNVGLSEAFEHEARSKRYATNTIWQYLPVELPAVS